MPQQSPVILLTRPAAQSAEFRAMLGGAAEIVVSPVIDIQPTKFTVDPNDYALIVFASQNAVQAAALCMDLKGHKAIAVGDKTAQAAVQLGMSAISARGDSADLIAAVLREKPVGKVLFVRGRHSQGDVEKNLKSAGLDTDSVIAYEQIALPLSTTAKKILLGKRAVILPMFSPRSAALLAEQVTQCDASAPLCLVALSADVLAAWDGGSPAQTAIAKSKTAAAMAEEILEQIAQWS